MSRLKFFAALSILFVQTLTPVNASLNGAINLDNPRVVPIFGQRLGDVASLASWSGYLYSPRIVFSAAHAHYKFDESGNRILWQAPLITVGKPNSAASDKNVRVKVIKTFIGDYKTSSVGSLNDFIVYVLEQDLAPISKGKLLTAEILKELVAAQTDVSTHGYGEFQDRCPGQPGPCKKMDFNDPKMMTSELPRSPIGSIKLVEPSYFSWLVGVEKEDLANHALLSDNLSCSGDSGGPTTAIYKGESIYLGTTPNGLNVRACGAGIVDDPTKRLGFFSPVYKHLDLIKEAEEFIKSNTKSKSKVSITCMKGKLVKKVSAINPKCPKDNKLKGSA